MESTGGEYAYAYGKGKLFSQVGAGGYPHALLVDSTGTIIYQGHPSGINEGLVAKAVETALAVPLYEWPDDLKKAAKSLRKGDLGKALSAVEAKGEAHAVIAASLQKMVEGRVAAVQKAADTGDWLAVKTSGETLADAVKGRPEADAVDALLDLLKKGDAKDILKAQEKIEKIFDRDIKSKQYEGLQKKINKIAEDFPANAAVQRDAERAQGRLRKICGKK